MKLRVSIGFVLILGYWAWCGEREAVPWLLAMVCHETGHLITAACLHIPVREIRLAPLGARISLGGRLLSYGEEAWVASAGPVVNLLAALALFRRFPAFAGYSLVLGLLNLLPIRTLDGGRLLYAVLSRYGRPETADAALRITSVSAAVAVWVFSVYFLLRYQASFSLFVLSCALFAGFAM